MISESENKSIFVAIETNDGTPACYGDTHQECVDALNKWNGNENLESFTYGIQDYNIGESYTAIEKRTYLIHTVKNMNIVIEFIIYKVSK